MAKAGHAKKRKSNNKIYAWLAACVVLLGVVIVSVFVLTMTPEKTIASGVAKLIESNSLEVDAESKTKSTMGDSNFKIAVRSADEKMAGTISGSMTGGLFGSDENIEFKADMFKGSDDMYVKVHDAEKLVDGIINGMFKAPEDATPELQEAYSQIGSVYSDIGKKMNGKWIKLDSSDLSGDAPEDDACSADFTTLLGGSQKVRSELAKVYKSHEFITVSEELDKKDGDVGYRLKLDKDAYKEFKKEAEDTEFAKDLKNKDCYDETFTFGLNDSANGTIDIWMDRVSRTITRIEQKSTSEGGNSSTSTVKLKYNAKVDESEPKEADVVTLDDIVPAEMRAAMTGAGSTEELAE